MKPPQFPQLGESFSVTDALESGISRDRLRRSDLTAPFYGVRSIVAEVPNGKPWEQDEAQLLRLCAAFATTAPLGYRFSHVTAARLYGVPLPYRLIASRVLDVTVTDGVQPPRGKGVRGHRSSVQGVVFRKGHPVLPIESVWLQLAQLLTVDELIVAGDYLIRRKQPASSFTALRDATEAHAGRRGCRQARLALAYIREGTDSPKETEVRLVIVRAGLPEPTVHFEVTHDGYFVGTPDLAYVQYRIAIEYQGQHHQTDRETYLSDIDRRELFERADWKVLEVTDAHLDKPGWLAIRVRELLMQRGWRP